MSYCNGCTFWESETEHCTDPYEWVNGNNLPCCRYQSSARMVAQNGVLEMLPCPFCGKVPDLGDPDTLYPIVVYWYTDDKHRRYYSPKGLNDIGMEGVQCYQLMCSNGMGGCGATLIGDVKQETIDNWNRRVYQ